MIRNMGFRRTCLHLSNRRWQKHSICLLLFLLLVCLGLHHLLVILDKNSGKTDNVLLITNMADGQNNIKEKISDVKKSISDIVYQGGDDENPSHESFLGWLGNKSVLSINGFKNEYKTSTKSLRTTIKPKKSKNKKWDGTKFISHYKFTPQHKKRANKYLYILGHYEQLGKTLINFMHASLLAAFMERKIVLPYVRNSRLCGLQSGWIGSPRKKSREFLVMDNYFDLHSLEEMFCKERFGDISQFDEFHNACEESLQQESVMLYFFYNGAKEEIKRYLMLSEDDYSHLEKQLDLNAGWADCLHIEKRVKSAQRLKGFAFTQALCIDAERITTVEMLNNLVFNATCVSVFLWRGIGPQRTHFNLSLSQSYENYLSRLSVSDIIMDEAHSFRMKYFSNEPYIGVQIRSERQLAWYGLQKFKHCLDLVVKVVSIFVYKKKIKHIFVSADLEKHGSDQMAYIMNSTALGEAKRYFRKSFETLPVEFYKPDKTRGLIHNDAGYVALTQMEILSKSSHLVTLGAGTFQTWMTSRFKKMKGKAEGSPPWSLTRVCSTETKAKKRTKSTNSTANPVSVETGN